MPTAQYSLSREAKKLDSIHREGIKIYTGAFLYRVRSNTLNSLDARENQIYVENNGATKPTGVNLRKMEQGYMKEQREVEENHPV